MAGRRRLGRVLAVVTAGALGLAAAVVPAVGGSTMGLITEITFPK